MIQHLAGLPGPSSHTVLEFKKIYFDGSWVRPLIQNQQEPTCVIYIAADDSGSVMTVVTESDKGVFNTYTFKLFYIVLDNYGLDAKPTVLVNFSENIVHIPGAWIKVEKGDKLA